MSRNVPVWLSEGMAEDHSTYELIQGGRKAVLGGPIESHVALLNETLKKARLLTLEELLKVDKHSPLYSENDRRSLFYAQAWALTISSCAASRIGCSSSVPTSTECRKANLRRAPGRKRSRRWTWSASSSATFVVRHSGRITSTSRTKWRHQRPPPGCCRRPRHMPISPTSSSGMVVGRGVRTVGIGGNARYGQHPGERRRGAARHRQT